MPMQPDLTDEQTLFRDTAVSFIEAELPVAGTRELHDDPLGYDPGLAAEVGRARLVRHDGAGSRWRRQRERRGPAGRGDHRRAAGPLRPARAVHPGERGGGRHRGGGQRGPARGAAARDRDGGAGRHLGLRGRPRELGRGCGPAGPARRRRPGALRQPGLCPGRDQRGRAAGGRVPRRRPGPAAGALARPGGDDPAAAHAGPVPALRGRGVPRRPRRARRCPRRRRHGPAGRATAECDRVDLR